MTSFLEPETNFFGLPGINYLYYPEKIKIKKNFVRNLFFFFNMITVSDALTLRALTLPFCFNVTIFEKFSKIDC